MQKYFTLKSYLLLITLFISFQSFSQLGMTLNKPSATYNVGETVTFTMPQGTYSYTIGYQLDFENAIAPISPIVPSTAITANTFTFNSATYNVGKGVVICRLINSLGTKQDIAVTFGANTISPFQDLTPTASVTQTQFDAFWDGIIATAKTGGFTPNFFDQVNDSQITLQNSNGVNYKLYKFRMRNIDGLSSTGATVQQYFTGSFLVPIVQGSYPIIVSFPTAGNPYPYTPDNDLKNIAIPYAIVAHISIINVDVNGVELNDTQPEYAPININGDPTMWDHTKNGLQYILSAYVRLAEYLKTTTTIQGVTYNGSFGIYGESRGGGLAIMAGGLSEKALFTQLKAVVSGQPALCEHLGYIQTTKRASGWHQYLSSQINNNPAKPAPTTLKDELKYFDAVNFAKRIKVPTFIGIGYTDELTPAATTFAALNQLQNNQNVVLHGLTQDHVIGTDRNQTAGKTFFKNFLTGFSYPQASPQQADMKAKITYTISGNTITFNGNVTGGTSLTYKWEQITKDATGNITATTFGTPTKNNTLNVTANTINLIKFTVQDNSNIGIAAPDGASIGNYFVTASDYVTVTTGTNTCTLGIIPANPILTNAAPSATLNASGCTGTYTWTNPSSVTSTGVSIVASTIGNYSVSCSTVGCSPTSVTVTSTITTNGKIDLTGKVFTLINGTTNGVAGNEISKLIDEQNLTTADLRTTPIATCGTCPSVPWIASWGTYPVGGAKGILDLGQEYDISHVFFLDGSGTGNFTINKSNDAIGTSVEASSFASSTLNNFNAWIRADNFGTAVKRVRYLVVTQQDANSRCNEIILYGTAVSTTCTVAAPTNFKINNSLVNISVPSNTPLTFSATCPTAGSTAKYYDSNTGLPVTNGLAIITPTSYVCKCVLTATPTCISQPSNVIAVAINSTSTCTNATSVRIAIDGAGFSFNPATPSGGLPFPSLLNNNQSLITAIPNGNVPDLSAQSPWFGAWGSNPGSTILQLNGRYSIRQIFVYDGEGAIEYGAGNHKVNISYKKKNVTTFEPNPISIPLDQVNIWRSNTALTWDDVDQIKFETTNDGSRMKEIVIYGCFVSSSRVGVEESITKFESNENNLFIIYPNPVNDKLNIEYNLVKDSELNFSIADMAGKNIQNTSINGKTGTHSITLDVSKMIEGSYILRGISEDKSKVLKFIIIR
jgi:cephalosporin-C deacetylase-like acetyl esterase